MASAVRMGGVDAAVDDTRSLRFAGRRRPMSEAALVRAAQRGFRGGRRGAVRASLGDARTAPRPRVHDRAAAEDIAQEAFLAAAARAPPLRPPPAARARGCTASRQPRDRPRARPRAAPRGRRDARARGGRAARGRARRARRARRGARGAGPDQRAVVVLRYLLDFTPGEIAAGSSCRAAPSTRGCAAGSTRSVSARSTRRRERPRASCSSAPPRDRRRDAAPPRGRAHRAAAPSAAASRCAGAARAGAPVAAVLLAIALAAARGRRLRGRRSRDWLSDLLAPGERGAIRRPPAARACPAADGCWSRLPAAPGSSPPTARARRLGAFDGATWSPHGLLRGRRARHASLRRSSRAARSAGRSRAPAASRSARWAPVDGFRDRLPRRRRRCACSTATAPATAALHRRARSRPPGAPPPSTCSRTPTGAAACASSRSTSGSSSGARDRSARSASSRGRPTAPGSRSAPTWLGPRARPLGRARRRPARRRQAARRLRGRRRRVVPARGADRRSPRPRPQRRRGRRAPALQRPRPPRRRRLVTGRTAPARAVAVGRSLDPDRRAPHRDRAGDPPVPRVPARRRVVLPLAWIQLRGRAGGGRRSPPTSGARLPARAALGAAGRVEPPAVDHHVGVAGVCVDRDVPAPARLAVAHEAAGVERRVEQAAAVQRVGDRARAVVARVVPLAVPAAVLVRLVRRSGWRRRSRAGPCSAGRCRPPRSRPRLSTFVCPGWPSAAHVAGPTTPSGGQPARALERLTAACGPRARRRRRR